MSEVKQRQTLPELAVDFLAYMQVMEANGGEMTPEWEAFETSLMSDLASNADSIYHVLKRLEVLAEADKADADSLVLAAKYKKRAVDRLKEMVRLTLSRSGLNSIAGNVARFSVCGGRGSLDIDEEKLPKEFWKKVVTSAPDKEMIRAELESGKEVPGARIVPTESLRISLGRK